MFFLSKGGSSTFLTQLDACAVAAAAAAGAGSAAGRNEAANSWAAALADAVAIWTISSTVSCDMVLVGWASRNCSSSVDADAVAAGGNRNVPRDAGLGDLERASSPRPS